MTAWWLLLLWVPVSVLATGVLMLIWHVRDRDMRVHPELYTPRLTPEPTRVRKLEVDA